MKKDDWDDYIPEGHKDIEVWHIGTIEFSEQLLQEEEHGGLDRLNINSIGICKIEVYSNEGNVPHFHLFTPNHSFETCICIYSNNFFSHDGKYRDKLNRKQCKILNEYLKQQDKRMPKLTVWEGIMYAWESANEDCKFSKDRKVNKQPDYSDMTQYRDK